MARGEWLPWLNGEIESGRLQVGSTQARVYMRVASNIQRGVHLPETTSIRAALELLADKEPAAEQKEWMTGQRKPAHSLATARPSRIQPQPLPSGKKRWYGGLRRARRRIRIDKNHRSAMQPERDFLQRTVPLGPERNEAMKKPDGDCREL